MSAEIDLLTSHGLEPLIADEHFGRDMAPLIEAIKFLRGPPRTALPWRTIGSMVAGLGSLAAALLLVWHFASPPAPSPERLSVAPQHKPDTEAADPDKERREADAIASAAEATRKADDKNFMRVSGD